ncbi:alpha/beta fold hydrolase [archaeon]|nr:MAG: alpha/beta fold hydrolase [archaeon]
MNAAYKNVKSLALSSGLRMAYQEWGAGNAKKVIALHGWLDNSNSYYYLGPYLAKHGYHCLAVDHVGHGLSDHLGVGAAYNILKSTACVTDFIRTLQWSQFHVVGHSMGASISMIYAAVMHENVDKLVLLEVSRPGLTVRID